MAKRFCFFFITQKLLIIQLETFTEYLVLHFRYDVNFNSF